MELQKRLKKFVIEHVSPKIWRIFSGSNFYDSEREIWEKYYPKGKGKYILDVGSDDQSLNFFYMHGAKKVYPIGKYFGSEISQGCIKIDIEGIERGMIIETHYANPKLVLLHDFGNGIKIWKLD